MPRLRLHGSPSIEHPRGPPVALSAREAAMLAWLHLDGPSPRATLAGRLWPGGTESQARANLRQLLLRLRRAAGDVLVETAGQLQLAPEVEVAPPSGRLLGPLEFDDAPELADWLDGQRDADRRDRLRDGLARARAALEAGRLDDALADADAVLATDPAAEEAHRLRMRVFWQRGDRAAAIQAWDDCRLALRQQFGVPPSAATNELGHRILAEEANVLPSATAPELPDALRRPPKLVGRERELAQVQAALLVGHGVSVRGPGGIGKSRLMAAVAESMEPALVVGGRPGDEHVPGAVASRLVAAALERFAPHLDAQTRADIQTLLPTSGAAPAQLQSALEHRRVLASVARTMLACHARGMRLVVVDDLQFSDDLSMEAIAVVIGGWLADPPERAAVPLFACRPDELREPARRLVHLLESSGRALRVDLGPLDPTGLAALLATLPLPPALAGHPQQLAVALHARVGGNPAYLVESLKTLWRHPPARWPDDGSLPLPDNLRAQVRQRLERLSPEALQLAQLAAVAQRDFSLPLAAAASGRAPLALAPLFAELEGAEVFQRGGFAHDLVAEAVGASLPGSLRPPLHRLVAEHLQAHRGEPGAIAHHLDAAGDPRAAAHWHQRAGDQARDRWRLPDAATHYEAGARALAAARAGAEREVRWLCLRGAAWARIGLGQMQQGDTWLEEAQSLSRTPLEEVAVLNSRVTVWLSLQRLEALRAAAQRLADGLAQPPAEWPAAERDRSWMSLAIAARFTRLARRALSLPEGHGGADGTASLAERIARGMLLAQAGDARGAAERLAPAIREAVSQRRYSHAFNGAQQWMRAGLALGDPDVQDEALAHLRLCVREAGLGPSPDVDVDQLQAMALLSRGQPEMALPLVDVARGRLADIPGRRPRLQLELVAAVTRLVLGDEAGATQILAGLPDPDGGPDADQACRAWVGAQLAARRGEPVKPWLERARRSDPNCTAGTDSLEQRFLELRLTPLVDPVANEAARQGFASDAEAAGRRPLLWALAAAPDAGRPMAKDPWLILCS